MNDLGLSVAMQRAYLERGHDTLIKLESDDQVIRDMISLFEKRLTELH